jgi:hypothetical protein
MIEQRTITRRTAAPEDGLRTFELFIGRRRIGALVEQLAPTGRRGTRWVAAYNPALEWGRAKFASEPRRTQAEAIDELRAWLQEQAA